MSSIEVARPMSRQKRITYRRVCFLAAALSLLGLTIWSAIGTEVSLGRLATGVPQIMALLERMFPPNLSMLSSLLWPTIETIEMALLGTTLPIFIAVPLSLLAASNTAPNQLILLCTRVVAAFLRTVPDLVWGMILVSAVGLGPMPGVLALTLHAIGGMTKLFYEAIESSEKGPIEAMHALGAGRIHTILFGVLPNVLPSMISSTLLYWEYNNRSAAVLGLVGAGGIGLAMTQALADFRYRDVSMCLLVIVVILVAIDFFSASLRKKVI